MQDVDLASGSNQAKGPRDQTMVCVWHGLSRFAHRISSFAFGKLCLSVMRESVAFLTLKALSLHQDLLHCFGQHTLLFQYNTRVEKMTPVVFLHCPVSAVQKQCALANAASTTRVLHCSKPWCEKASTTMKCSKEMLCIFVRGEGKAKSVCKEKCKWWVERQQLTEDGGARV